MPVFRRLVLSPLEALGRYVVLLARAFRTFGEWRIYRRGFFEQCVKVGIDSMPIIALASAFAAAVTTVQAAYQLVSPFIPKSTIGAVVGPSIILELGTLVSGFVLAGRVGARIAAELGTMRVTEQIDALEAMGLSSSGYLVVPRVLAGLLTFPILYIFSTVVGITSAVLVADLGGFLSRGEFLAGMRSFFHPFDATFGLIKSAVFGFVITSISCFRGYYAQGGAEGVGRATTEAAVLSCVGILVADLVLAVLLLG
ncbi:MAG: ABC transporter permease [Rhodothermales bacterium]|nr:ABC transporter permease [Rhodothermales bacterium]